MFSLDHHRLGARTDCGFDLRPLPALAFGDSVFVCVASHLSPLDDRDVWLAFGLAVVLPQLGLQVYDYDVGGEETIKYIYT